MASNRLCAAAVRPLAWMALLVAGPAMAHIQAGTSCRLAQVAVKGLQYSGTWIAALHSPTTEVICPVDRLVDIPPAGNFMIYVYADAGTGTISCNFESYNAFGNLLGYQGFQLTGSISYQLVLTAAQVPSRSAQVLHCTMTPGSRLYSYESFERSM